MGRHGRKNRRASNGLAEHQHFQPRVVAERLEARLLLATIFTEDFEGVFPASNWSVNTSQSRTWDDTNYKAHAGSWSGFGAEFQGNNATNTYVNNMATYMERTVNLSGYTSASLSFWRWQNTEVNFDYLRLKINGTEVFNRSTAATSWAQHTVNLDSYAGQSSVTVRFEFTSDGSGVPTGDAGVWLDDISLTASGSNPPPVINSFTDTPDPVALHGIVSLSATASDAGGSVSSVSFYFENNGIGGLQTGSGGDFLLFADAISPYGVDVNTINLTAGTYTYYAFATDNQSATSTVAVTTNTIQGVNQLPRIDTFTDSPDPVSVNGTVTLSATASDPDASISKVSFYQENNGISGLQTGSGGDFLLFGDSTSPYAVGVTQGTAGTYTYYAFATDNQNAGGAVATTTNTVSARLAAPTLSAPNDGAVGVSRTPQFSWTQVSGNQGYRIIVSTNQSDLPTDPTQSGGTPSNGFNQTVAQGITTYTWSGTLSAGTTYYWEVHALGTSLATAGLWSNVNSFTTATPQPPPSVYIGRNFEGVNY